MVAILFGQVIFGFDKKIQRNLVDTWSRNYPWLDKDWLRLQLDPSRIGCQTGSNRDVDWMPRGSTLISILNHCSNTDQWPLWPKLLRIFSKACPIGTYRQTLDLALCRLHLISSWIQIQLRLHHFLIYSNYLPQ